MAASKDNLRGCLVPSLCYYNELSVLTLTGPNDMLVAHLFYAYLNITENWCYGMIANFSNIDIMIVSETCLNIEKFPLPSAKFSTPKRSEHVTTDTTLLHKILKYVFRLIWFRFVLPSHLKQADLLHAHFSTVAWKYLPLSRKLHIPLAVSFYGFDYEWLPEREPKWRQRYAVLFDKAALVLVEGSVGKSKLVKMGCSPSKVHVARLGVDVSKIPFLLRAKKPGNLRLVQIATFTAKKGYSTTVEAFAHVAMQFQGMDLTLVGRDRDGLRPELERLISRYGIADRVQFIDGIDFSKLHEYLLDFHVFIHPSRYAESGDSEGGAPIVLLDAQATGMPVLSTTHCDIPDEVVHGETGILVAENDVIALADAIKRFYLMDQAEYNVFCHNARRHVEAHYDVRLCAERLQQIYADTLGHRDYL